MSVECGICTRIERLDAANPYFIAELATGFAVLGENQMYEGYTIFVAKRCVPELHDLPPGERSLFLDEMSIVAEAVFRAFSPRKLNYELLGNSVTHLHWHLFPRYAGDANPDWPVWNNRAFLDAPRRTAIDSQRLANLRDCMQTALEESGTQ